MFYIGKSYYVCSLVHGWDCNIVVRVQGSNLLLKTVLASNQFYLSFRLGLIKNRNSNEIITVIEFVT